MFKRLFKFVEDEGFEYPVVMLCVFSVFIAFILFCLVMMFITGPIATTIIILVPLCLWLFWRTMWKRYERQK